VIPLADTNPTARRAVVTFLLIVVNIAIYYGIQYPKSGDAEANFEYKWAGIPCELHTGKPIEVVPSGPGSAAPTGCVVEGSDITEPQTAFPHKNIWLAVLFSMFLHASTVHVLGNMLFLWIFGNNVEDQLGHLAYLALYLVGGIVASLVYVLGNLSSVDPFLGASGAIAVIMGAYIVWFPRARVLVLLSVIPLRLPAWIVLGLWFVLQFFTGTSSGIATLAHIGGFVFGMIVAIALVLLAHFPHRRTPAPHAGAF